MQATTQLGQYAAVQHLSILLNAPRPLVMAVVSLTILVGEGHDVSCTVRFMQYAQLPRCPKASYCILMAAASLAVETGQKPEAAFWIPEP